jgi:hypothetical protein
MWALVPLGRAFRAPGFDLCLNPAHRIWAKSYAARKRSFFLAAPEGHFGQPCPGYHVFHAKEARWHRSLPLPNAGKATVNVRNACVTTLHLCVQLVPRLNELPSCCGAAKALGFRDFAGL